MTAKPSFSQMMNRQHLGTVRALGYALTHGSHDGWLAFRRIITLRLSNDERAALAFCGLRSLADEHAEIVMRAAGDLMEPQRTDGAGAPISPLFNAMHEATFWAGIAAPAELDAYCLATFDAMHPARRAAFLDYVTGRTAE